MVDTVIRAGIAYSFYAVPYSLPAIKKLDKKIIGIQKVICGLPKCTANIITQLPRDMFGLEAFSLKNAYLRCISEQLRNALNDPGRLGTIYKGLIQHILAKHGGAQDIQRIKYQDCIRSPTTRTLFLMKKEGGAHLKSIEANFQLHITELEKEWRTQATNELPQLSIELSLKLLHKLLNHNIQKVKHISLPNGTHLMSPKDFQTYYKTPTKLDKSALHIAEQLFCHQSCNQNCTNMCNRHPQARTLKTKYISNNAELTPRLPTNPPHPPILQQPQKPNPPHNIKNNPIRFPIQIILNHKSNETKDKYKITKRITTYLCQWSLQNNTIYHKWIPQNELFPLHQPPVIEHNTSLLKEYYTKHQHNHYNKIIHTYATPIQAKDPKYIPPPTLLPYTQISIIECNPEKDITTIKNTIQTQNEITHIYEDTGRHLITIPTTRLKWLWQQYNIDTYSTYGLVPPPQPFETEIVWLYQRYNPKKPKKDPLKTAQHTLPQTLLDAITNTLNITHSYFSSPVTCSTHISKFYSPFTRDKIFGSLGTAFQYKWNGIGYAHPHNEETTQQAIHWARLAAKHDPDTITILVTPDINWYLNYSPHTGPFPDTRSSPLLRRYHHIRRTNKPPKHKQTTNRTISNTHSLYSSPKPYHWHTQPNKHN